MARQTHLQRRGARYWARIRVPRDLIAAFDGKKELVRSLETADPMIARERCIDITARTSNFFVRMRNEMDEATRRAIAQQFYADEIKKDELRRSGGVSKRQNHLRAKKLRADYAAILATLATGDHGGDNFFDGKAREAIASFGLPISSESDPDFAEVRGAIQRALQEAYRRQIERDAGDWSGVAVDPLLAPPPTPVPSPAHALAVSQGASEANQNAGAGESACDLFTRYEKANPNRITADTMDQARKSFDLFAQIFPQRRFTAREIAKSHIRDWKHLLEQYPIRAADTNEFKGLTIQQVVSKNIKIKKPIISQQTINKHLSFIGAFCSWLILNDYLDKNPVDGNGLSPWLRRTPYVGNRFDSPAAQA